MTRRHIRRTGRSTLAVQLGCILVGNRDREMFRSILNTTACFALLSASIFPAVAQWLHYPTAGIPRTSDGKPNLTAPTPKTPDGRPDLSGLWMPTRPTGKIPPEQGSYASLQYFMAPGATIPPMLPEAEALYRKRFENFGAGRPSEHCMPHGVPDAMIVPGPVKFVQNPGVTFLLYEEFNHFRQVFTDGRDFPRDMTPAWFGYFHRKVGRRHVCRRYHRLQRPDLARRCRPSSHRPVAHHRTIPPPRLRAHGNAGDHRRPQGVHQAVDCLHPTQRSCRTRK